MATEVKEYCKDRIKELESLEPSIAVYYYQEIKDMKKLLELLEDYLWV